MDKYDLLASAIAVLIVLGILVGVVYGGSYLYALTFAGQTYEVTVTVQAIEHSTRFGQHTNVWARVYGDQDVSYRLIGFVNLEVGKTYKITFINQPWFTILGFEIRGYVLSIEEVNATSS